MAKIIALPTTPARMSLHQSRVTLKKRPCPLCGSHYVSAQNDLVQTYRSEEGVEVTIQNGQRQLCWTCRSSYCTASQIDHNCELAEAALEALGNKQADYQP